MTSQSLSEEFMKTNIAYYRAKLSSAMHNLMNSFPEAGMYLQDLIEESHKQQSDIEITDLFLRQRFVDFALIDPSSKSIRIQHALALREAFEMEDNVRARIFAIHNPDTQPQQLQDENCCTDAVATTAENKPQIGFRLRPSGS